MNAVTNTNNVYKILSLDGGGTWALIQAIALADIYGLHTAGRQILKNYNLAIANSGGSLVLAGLLVDMTPLEIFNLFNSKALRNIIFDKHWFHIPGFRQYRTESKLSGLLKAFSGKPDIECKVAELNTLNVDTEIVICAYDYDRERAKFFRSNVNSAAAGAGGSGISKVTLIQAIHASSTAPVKYFDDPALIPRKGWDSRYWDGAVAGYNNPVMAGVIEAIANDPSRRSNIRVLSIGTANTFLPVWTGGLSKPDKAHNGLYKIPQHPCLMHDLSVLAQSIISDPPDAASFIAHTILGGHLPGAGGAVVRDGPLVRINPLIQPRGTPNAFSFPVPTNPMIKFTPADFMRLTKLGLDAVAQEDINCIKRFAAMWLENDITNQAIRADGATLRCEIGHMDYTSAVAQWKTYDPRVITDIHNRQEILQILIAG